MTSNLSLGKRRTLEGCVVGRGPNRGHNQWPLVYCYSVAGVLVKIEPHTDEPDCDIAGGQAGRCSTHRAVLCDVGIVNNKQQRLMW